MRLLMTQARVELSDDETPVSVEWDAPAGLLFPATQGASDRSTPDGTALAGRAPGRGAPGRHPLRRPGPPRRVINVLDDWRYAGRWWEPRALRRGYYLLELEDGAQLELFREGDTWWVARTTD